MAIRPTKLTRGFGNGTFSGVIKYRVRQGFSGLLATGFEKTYFNISRVFRRFEHGILFVRKLQNEITVRREKWNSMN